MLLPDTNSEAPCTTAATLHNHFRMTSPRQGCIKGSIIRLHNTSDPLKIEYNHAHTPLPTHARLAYAHSPCRPQEWYVPALNLTLTYAKFDQYKPRRDANCTALCFKCENGKTFCREAHGLTKGCRISKTNQRAPTPKIIKCNKRPVLTSAILELILRVNSAFDLVFASFGYHYHPTQVSSRIGP